MILRTVVLTLVMWLLGFAAFGALLPRPAGNERTDGIVVLTGGEGRINRGVDLLRDKRAQRMLVTGVDRRVTKAALAKRQDVPLSFLKCCVDLGFEAVDTRSNARETANWLRRQRYRSVRLVTTDWHMRRAEFELEIVLGNDVRVIPDAVRSHASLSVLFLEYNKWLFRRVAGALAQ